VISIPWKSERDAEESPGQTSKHAVCCGLRGFALALAKHQLAFKHTGRLSLHGAGSALLPPVLAAFAGQGWGTLFLKASKSQMMNILTF